MDFQILGPLEVRSERGAVAVEGLKPRAVLAMLLLHANEPVTAERLAVALWGEDAPAGAVKTVHVSRLRKTLGDPKRSPPRRRLPATPDRTIGRGRESASACERALCACRG